MVGLYFLLALVDARFLRHAEAPNDLALQRELGHLAVLHVAHVEELLFAFLAEVDPVPPGETLAEGADEAAGLVEDGDGVHRRFRVIAVLDIDEALLLTVTPCVSPHVMWLGNSPQLWLTTSY